MKNADEKCYALGIHRIVLLPKC